jgi:hypothetical protein
MGAVRNLASKLLHAVLRYAPVESREWVEAMLRELDFIENDWAALFWALGSITAIFRYCGRVWIARLRRQSQEEKMKDIGKKTVGVVSGILMAAALVVTAFGLLFLTAKLFPALGIDRAEWTHVLTIVIIPETIFVIAAAMLWRKRGPVAAGILVTGVVLAVHVAAHFVMH